MPVALTFLSILGCVASVILLRRAIWRDGNFLVCRTCGYDLRGTLRPDEPAPPCPECGTTLTRENRQWAIDRAQRTWAVWCGGALALVSATVLAACLYGWLMSWAVR